MDNTKEYTETMDVTVNNHSQAEQEQTAVPASTDETDTAAESETNQSPISEIPTSTISDSGDIPAAMESRETSDANVSDKAPENSESMTEETPEVKSGDEKPTEETEIQPKTQESIEVPVTEAVQKNNQNGNWGIVAIIILLIAALGAALTLIILRRRKNGETKNRQGYEKIQETEIQQDASGSRIACGVAQTIGKREQQQDSLYCSNWKDPRTLMTRGLIAAVADGIGGLKDGHLASQGAMQAIRSAFLEGPSDVLPSDRLLTYAAAAQKSVLQLNQTSNCGATLVSVLITGKTMQFLSIGDSRIYLYRAGALLQLNREHILRRTNEEKEQFYGTGEKLTKKRAGALTSYLGKENLTLIDRSLQPITLLPGDRIALMSDGVFNTLSEREIMIHLRKNPEAAAQEMIQDVDAHANPVQDNASVVVIGIE